MKRLIVIFSAGTLALAAALGASLAQAPTQPGTVLADGYHFSIGSAVDAQCNVYVAEGGTEGPTGQITRVNRSTGAKTVLASEIPSTSMEGAAFGAIDVTLLDGTVYYLLTGQDEPVANNGVYRIEADGSSTLVANIGAFNKANPVTFPDALPTGNPYSINTYDGGFLVVDGNYNRLLKVGLDGSISILISLGNVVPTGATISPDGHIVWAQIGPFPHEPADGKVLRLHGTTATTLAGGYANVIDVKYGADGRLYALIMGDMDATGEAPAVPFTGKIAIVNADGTLSPIVEGLMFSTSLEICNGDAYVTGLSGETRVIANIASLQPAPTPTPTATPSPTAQPTPTPRVTPAPPATGTGQAASDQSSLALLLAALAVLAGTAGVAAAARRRV